MSRPPLPLIRVRGLLAEERSLALLLPEARRLAELNRRFMAAVTPGLGEACRVAALEGETAVVFCGHGAAASRLRSQAKTVAQALSRAGAPVSALKVRVRADWAAPGRVAKAGMDANALAAWRALRDTLPEGELKAAVGRLLDHQQGDGRG